MWNGLPTRILVPVDFGPASARALAVAAALATRAGARLRVLHVETLEAPPYFTHDQLAELERQRRAARARAVRYVEEFAGSSGAEGVEAALAEGTPAAAIIEAARCADLVVMGTHGRRGASRWWLGSVAEAVVRASPAPVLVVRAAPAGVPPAGVFSRPAVVATDDAGNDAARAAADLSALVGGEPAREAPACQADLAKGGGPTLVVVSRSGTAGGRPALDRPEDEWLRGCGLPMLFLAAPPRT